MTTTRSTHLIVALHAGAQVADLSDTLQGQDGGNWDNDIAMYRWATDRDCAAAESQVTP